MKVYTTDSTDIDSIAINRSSRYATSIDRKQYEEDLKRIQQEHLDSIQKQNDLNWQPCMHDACTECHGTGVTRGGGACVHFLSCQCLKCTPRC